MCERNNTCVMLSMRCESERSCTKFSMFLIRVLSRGALSVIYVQHTTEDKVGIIT